LIFTYYSEVYHGINLGRKPISPIR